MSDIVKAALILAAAAIICTGAAIFFSPYHSCMRSIGEGWTGKACLGS